MKKNRDILTVPFEKSKTVSFVSLIIKSIAVPRALFRLSVKLICCFAFGSASNLNLLQLIHNISKIGTI